MKRIFFALAVFCMLAVLIYAADTKAWQIIRAGTKEICNDTLIGSDTIYIPLHHFPEYTRGFYRFMYICDSIDDADFGNGVKIRYQETLDTLYGWHNTTTIDSVVTPETTLVIDSTTIHGIERGRFAIYSDVGTDSIHFILKLQVISDWLQ